jgi:RNA polymerase sigma-70 factor (ECF subfamily)
MATVPFPAAQTTPPELCSDEMLVARVLEGERQAFELLMRRSNARLYRAIRSVIRDEEQVEELMQQTYLLAFTRLGQFSGGARFSTWLIRIGLNEALQRVRRTRRWPLVAVDAIEEDGEMGRVDAVSPEQRLACAELTRLLEGLVDELPEPYRVVFVLREVQQLSTSEVAEALEISPENVKQRLSRGKSLLRSALERRTGENLRDLYPFHAPRCDAVVAGVWRRLASSGAPTSN